MGPTAFAEVEAGRRAFGEIRGPAVPLEGRASLRVQRGRRKTHGEHGEIFACILAPDEAIVSCVMSCRVWQRRFEFAFIQWLSENSLHREAVRMRHRHYRPGLSLRRARVAGDRAFRHSPGHLVGMGLDGRRLAVSAIENRYDVQFDATDAMKMDRRANCLIVVTERLRGA
jgi:hypothetical protein